MNCQGAIFDQDGLLFDTESIYQRAWVEAGARQGVAVPAAFPRRFCGLSPKAIGAIAAAAFPALDIARYCRDAIDLAWSRQLAGVPVKKPGLLEMLTFCRTHGIRTAVASSSTLKVVEHNLAAAGVRGFFDAIATGDEVTHGKPAPDIFLLAARKIGIAPDRCVVFEDAESGIRGAVAAGCRAVMIPDGTVPSEEMRALCRVVPDLRAAVALL
jgi:beta-phosphoglucomutase-like phosphatase (HAD superfamily)